MRAHLLFDHHLAVILKDLVHVLCDAIRFGQANLDFMYAEGRGVPHDKERAVHYLRLAADQGHANAQEVQVTVVDLCWLYGLDIIDHLIDRIISNKVLPASVSAINVAI
jgi:hypothetical protein